MSAPRRHTYRVLFTNRTLSAYVGHPLDTFAEIVIIPRFNEPGSCEVTVEAFPWLMTLLNTPGTRAQILRDGVSEVAGPIEAEHFTFSSDTDGEDGNGFVTFNFADDLALLAGLLSYPNPALAATAQDVPRYLISAVVAETAMRALVNLNAGPGALADRQVPGLILGAALGVGSVVTYSTRFQPMCDDLRAIAIAGGRLGFRTVQVGLTVEFQVYAPDDLTTSARFSRGRGNLQDIDYQIAGPTITVAIVGGEDAGAARVIRERVNASAIADGWPRVERFIDRRDITVTAELDAAGDDELDAGAPSTRLGVVAIDTDANQYRIDYAPGDIVSVQVVEGVTVPEIIQAVEIHVTPDHGETVAPIIGTTDAVTSGPTAALQRAIQRQQAISATAGEIPV